MTRGGRTRARAAPERRCIATGTSGPRDGLIRFVLGPGHVVVPDLAEKLPGRGAWLSAERALVERAVAKKLFARAFRQPVSVADDLPDRLEASLAERLIQSLAMARKAGRAVTGFEKVRGRILDGAAGLLVQARDGAPDGLAKIAKLEPELPRVRLLTSAELGVAFGREFAVHAAVDAGKLSARVLSEAVRLSGFRPEPSDGRADPRAAGHWKDRANNGARGATGGHASAEEETGRDGGRRERGAHASGRTDGKPGSPGGPDKDGG
ncbi:MAG: RNA-binding protein [Paracoccaceae bacterium]